MISAVKWLIAINPIQNKSIYLHNISMCTVYIYVYVNTHTHTAYILKIFKCKYLYSYNVYYI